MTFGLLERYNEGYDREPLRFIAQDEIQQLLRRNGFHELKGRTIEIKTQGQTFEGVYVKQN